MGRALGTVLVEGGMRLIGWTAWMLTACVSGETAAPGDSGGGGSADSAAAGDSGGTDSGASGALPALDCPPDSVDDCCREPIGLAVVCSDTAPFEQWVPGRLTSWDPQDGGVFVDEAGAEHDIWVWLSGDVALPDVPLDSPVELWMRGWCEQGLFALRTSDERLIFAAGFETDGDVGGWTIDVAFDAQTCVGRDDLRGCYERMHTSPVSVSHAGTSWSLLHGQSASAAGATLTVGMSFSGSGDPLCDDGPGPSAAFWWILPDDGESADPPRALSGLVDHRLGTCDGR